MPLHKRVRIRTSTDILDMYILKTITCQGMQIGNYTINVRIRFIKIVPLLQQNVPKQRFEIFRKFVENKFINFLLM